MKISGSIFAVKGNYFTYAKNLQYSNVDFLHIDLFQYEENKDFALEDILKFDDGYLPLDVHLIYHSISDADINILNKANVQYLNVQYETLKDKDSIWHISQKFRGSFGLAVTARTGLEVIETYIDAVSQILFMCSEPGVSGAKFDAENFKRIEEIKEKYPNLHLFADGGINDEISKKLNSLGVEMIVSGSFLAANIEDIEEKVYTLKYVNEEKIKVTRNMIPLVKLPLLDRETPFMEIINVMNQYRRGIVFVMDKNSLLGIITDGDIRRGFTKFQEKIFDRKAENIMNRDFFWIDHQKNMHQLFSCLFKMHRGIDVIPVMDTGKLLGAVDIRTGY